MATKSYNVLHTLSFQSSLATCTHVRKIQLPARAFQLLARPSTSPNKPWHRLIRTHASFLHTMRNKRDQQDNTSKVDQQEVEEPSPSKIVNSVSVDGLDGPELESSTSPRDRLEKSRSRSRAMFRDYMRKVSHPVAIVTSTDTGWDVNGGPNSWRGATVSSFNSVTIHPEPYVSFNIKKHSSTYDAIQNSNIFAVHLMSATPQAGEMASIFAQGRYGTPFFDKTVPRQGQASWKLRSFVHKRARWYSSKEDLDVSKLPPYLQWSPTGHTRAVLFHMLCKFQKHKTIEVGDHVILIGKVVRMKGNLEEEYEKTHQGSVVPKDCLTYANGGYNAGAGPEMKAIDRTSEKNKEDGGSVVLDKMEVT